MPLIEGKNVNDLWTKAFDFLDKNGREIESQKGKTKEVCQITLELENPQQRWLTAREKPMNPAFSIAEVVWIINGCSDASLINPWNPALPKFAGKVKNYYGAYGKRIKENFGFDQFKNAYKTLKNSPETRQVVIQIWDPTKDFPFNTGKARASDIPCNICSLLKLRDGKLHWKQIMRSNDLFKGLPNNIVQFTTLQELMADWLNAEVGTYSHFSDSLHFYYDDISHYGYRERPISYHNIDTLNLTPSNSSYYFNRLLEVMKRLSKKNLSKDKFLETIGHSFNNQAIENMKILLSSDIAMRREWVTIFEGLISQCSNPLYVEMMREWNSFNT